MKTRKLGALYINGRQVALGQDLKHLVDVMSGGELRSIVIKEAPAEYSLDGEPFPALCKITWVDNGDLLMADRAICTNVSWKDLERAGFVEGVKVEMDGKSYLCKLPTGGDNSSVPNEWDRMCRRFGSDNSFWHCGAVGFWCKEKDLKNSTNRLTRGYSLAVTRLPRRCNTRSESIGFRPVLIPMFKSDMAEEVVGKEARVYGSGGFLQGVVQSVDDYDLIIRGTSAEDDDKFPWAKDFGGDILVNRGDIIWLEEA